MVCPVTRASQAVNVFFSLHAKKGSGGQNKGGGRSKPKKPQTGVANIKNLHGKNLKWIIKQKPKGWKTVPSDNGRGLKWVDENNVERLRFTRPSGKNAANSQWSRQENGYLRWKNAKDEFLDINGKVVSPTSKDYLLKTHIPYEGI